MPYVKRQQCVLRGLKEIDELPGYSGGDTLNDCFTSFHRAPPLKLNRIAVLRKHLGSHEPNAHECSTWKSFPQPQRLLHNPSPYEIEAFTAEGAEHAESGMGTLMLHLSDLCVLCGKMLETTV